MEIAMNSGKFEELAQREMYAVDGGGAIAFVYALGFVFGCPPAYVVGGAIILAGAGCIAVGRCIHR